MENELAALSNELAGAVERAGRVVVAVNARPRFGSSGVLWRPGIVVTAEHAIRRRDEIGITLPDGRTTSATLAGRDAGTDLAVLKLAETGAPTAAFGATETLKRFAMKKIAQRGLTFFWRSRKLELVTSFLLLLYLNSSLQRFLA